MRRVPAQVRILLVALTFTLAPRVALACPVCFGNSDSPMAKAVNMGIVAMLVVTAGILGAFAMFFVNLVKRSKLAEDEALGVASAGTEEGTVQC